MNYLEEKILNEAIVIDEKILKVDHFINQKIDIAVLRFAGHQFAEYFKDKGITKILTIEASGIAFGIATAFYLDDLPVVFAKKEESKLSGNDYTTEVYSFTKQKAYNIRVNKDFIDDKDNVLIIDDFLANGKATLGLIDIVEQAEATLIGVGIVIEKSFQQGRSILENKAVDVYSLVKIKSLTNNIIEFTD